MELVSPPRILGSPKSPQRRPLSRGPHSPAAAETIPAFSGVACNHVRILAGNSMVTCKKTAAPQIRLPKHSILQTRTCVLKGVNRKQMLDEASPLGPQGRWGPQAQLQCSDAPARLGLPRFFDPKRWVTPGNHWNPQTSGFTAGWSCCERGGWTASGPISEFPSLAL